MSYFDLLTSVSPKTTHIFLSTKQFCDREDPRKLLGPVIFNCGGGRVFGPPRTGLMAINSWCSLKQITFPHNFE